MKNTKAALLTSVLSLLLCVSMLVGTTFAWFTDTASTGVNKIQAGNLTVEIQDKNGDTLEGKMLKWETADGRTQDQIFWEPGARYQLEPFTIKNVGNLALKFNILITGIVGDAKLLEVIDFTYTTEDGDFDINAEHKLGAGNETKPITIKGVMKETAGNEYQGLSIDGISITVYATQDTVEQDSYDEKYDENASYRMESGLSFTSGSHVLTTGVTATAADADAVRASGAGTEVTIEGGAFDGGENGNNVCIFAKDGASVTIKDGTFTVGKDGNGEGNSVVYVTSGATVTIEGGFFYTNTPYNNFYYVLNQNNGKPGTITVKGGTFVNFDPSKGDDNLGGNFVASGYKVVSETQANGDVWYTVVEEQTQVSEYGLKFTKTGEDTLNSGVKATADNAPAVTAIGKDVVVTITGGEFTAEGSNAPVIFADDDATVVISGGFFYANNGNPLLKEGNSSGYILLKGGTFVNFDPSDFTVRYDCKVVAETKENGDTWYTVVKIPEGDIATEFEATSEVMQGLQNWDSVGKLLRTDGYTYYFEFYKKHWNSSSNVHFYLKAATADNADIKITKKDGTIDYIQIDMTGLKVEAGSFIDDVFVYDEEITAIEFTDNGEWTADYKLQEAGGHWYLRQLAPKSQQD